MTQQKSMTLLSRLSANREKAPLARLGRARRELAEARAQAELLENYRIGYQQRLQQSMLEGIRASDYRNLADFIDHLDRILEQQVDIVERRTTEFGAAQQRWIALHRETRKYEVLLARQEAHEQLALRRAEQKLMDEMAARTFRISA